MPVEFHFPEQSEITDRLLAFDSAPWLVAIVYPRLARAFGGQILSPAGIDLTYATVLDDIKSREGDRPITLKVFHRHYSRRLVGYLSDMAEVIYPPDYPPDPVNEANIAGDSGDPDSDIPF